MERLYTDVPCSLLLYRATPGSRSISFNSQLVMNIHSQKSSQYRLGNAFRFDFDLNHTTSEETLTNITITYTDKYLTWTNKDLKWFLKI